MNNPFSSDRQEENFDKEVIGFWDGPSPHVREGGFFFVCEWPVLSPEIPLELGLPENQVDFAFQRPLTNLSVFHNQFSEMTIFSRIVQGEIPCHKIAETADYLAFLDVRPQVKGHTLVIPKKEIDYIFDVEDDALAGLIVFAKKVARAIEKVVPCKRIGVVVIGLEVPHAHVHLIPLNSMADMNFTGQARVSLSPEEMSELAAEIARNV